MQISVEFPSVVYREGPAKVVELARGIEAIGFDDLAMFDHVVMGYPTETRRAPMYPPQMPILEALVTLGFVASVTERVSLSTEVLVLPQRQAVLVAKQVSTLDTLSAGRVRLGVGVGWQEAEYEALGADFSHRGRVIDEAIALLRACWADERIDHRSGGFHVDAIAMEPKPPQGGDLPIWVGGTAPAALRRAGRLGAGWMGMVAESPEATGATITEIRKHAEAAGRDPLAVELQAMLAPPPNDRGGKAFYGHRERVLRRAEEIASLGFGWLAINATAVFQSGSRSVDAIANELATLHSALRNAVG